MSARISSPFRVHNRSHRFSYDRKSHCCSFAHLIEETEILGVLNNKWEYVVGLANLAMAIEEKEQT